MKKTSKESLIFSAKIIAEGWNEDNKGSNLIGHVKHYLTELSLMLFFSTGIFFFNKKILLIFFQKKKTEFIQFYLKIKIFQININNWKTLHVRLINNNQYELVNDH